MRSNFVSKLIGEGGVRVFSALFIFLLARNLPVADFGHYSTAFAFVSFFLILVNPGMDAVVTREIARRREERIRVLRSANAIKFSAAGAAFLGVLLFSHAFPFAREHRLLVGTLAVMVISYGLIDYMGAALAGQDEMGWEAWLRTLCRALVSACGIGALFWTKSLVAVTLSMSVASLLSLGLGLGILRARFGALPIGWDGTAVKQLFKSSLPLLGSVVFAIFYEQQDILLLNHFRVPEESIALFAAAAKIIDVFKVAPLLLAGTFFPALSRFAHEHESFLHNSRRLVAYAIVFLLLIAGGAYITAPLLVRLPYGPRYAGAAALLRIMLAAYVAVFLNHLCLQMLIAKDREKQLLVGAVVACASKLALNAWLIPRYGAPGACYSLVGSAFLFLAFQARLLTQAVPGLLLSPLDFFNPWSLIWADSKGIIKRFRPGSRSS